MNFKFYTNPMGEYPYHLIPYSKFRKGYKKHYDNLIIDCGVNELIGKKEYKYINEYPLHTSENVFWVCPDYPFDVNPNLTQEECIEKTWININKWKNEKNIILSVQYKFECFESFVENYSKIYQIANYIGIGNLCKSKNMVFLKKIINYIKHNNIDNKPIHFFGLIKPAIKYLLINCSNVNFDISVDSMKWDYGMHKNRLSYSKSNTIIERWKVGVQYINEFNELQNEIKQFNNITNLSKY